MPTVSNPQVATGLIIALISVIQIQISNKKNFKQKQTFSPKQSQTKQVIRKYKGKKLKAGKDYFIRVRAYTVSNGKKVYGQWTRLRCLA